MWVIFVVFVSLHKTQIHLLTGIINTLNRVFSNTLQQALDKITTLHHTRNFQLKQFYNIHNKQFVLNKKPFDGALNAINIDALAILPRDVKKAANDSGADVRTLELDMGNFDGERRAVTFDEILA